MPDVAGYRRLVNNATAALGGRLAAIAFGVALATILFRALGAQRYGQWALLTLLAGYSTLIDFGLSSAIERRVASLVAKGEDALIPSTLNTSLTVLLVAVSAAELLMAAAMALPWAASLEAGTRRALLALPLCSGITLAALSAGAALAGQQRMIALYGWRTLGLAAGTVAVAGAVASGVTGLDVLLFLYSAGSVLTFALVWRSLGSTVPALRLRLAWHRGALSDLFWFGGVVQFATMVPPLAEYAFRLIVSARFGLAYSGVYDLGARAGMVPRSLAGSLFAAMIPFAVQTERRAGTAGIRDLVRTTVRHVALFILPGSALLLAFSEPLVRLWLGPAALQEQVRRCFEILLSAHAIGALAVPAAMVGRALGRPVPEALFTAVTFMAAVLLAQVVPSFVVATIILWGLPAAGGFGCWIVLDRLVNVGFVNVIDALSIVGVAVLTFAAARALLPSAEASPVDVLARFALSGVVAMLGAALVEFGGRRWRVAPVPAAAREWS